MRSLSFDAGFLRTALGAVYGEGDSPNSESPETLAALLRKATTALRAVGSDLTGLLSASSLALDATLFHDSCQWHRLGS